MSKKKVLVIIGNLSNSGAPLTTLHFIQALNAVFDFDVLVLNAKTPQDLMRRNEYEKYCKNLFIKTFNSMSLISHGKERKKTIKFILNLTRSLHYDLVFSISGLLSAYLFKELKAQNNKLQTIFYSLGPGAIRRKGVNILSRLIYSFKFRKTIKNADFIFYISSKCVNKQMLKTCRSIELPDYPEIEKDSFEKETFKKRLGILATISRNKNQLFCVKLLENLNKNDDFKLIFMGNIIEESYYNKINFYLKRKGLNENIIFISGNSDKKCFFNQIDYLLLPSKREGLPLVLLESQYLGIPCISSLAIPESANLGGLIRLKLSVRKWSEYILNNKPVHFTPSLNLKENFINILHNCFGIANEIENS